mmetsp:Transcript_5991/g.17948  ORF Transcript_5991/g.17948 Transcript_5991/m.17948 type:complete len:496 (+) Transcript_5991:118-1605(+)
MANIDESTWLKMCATLEDSVFKLEEQKKLIDELRDEVQEHMSALLSKDQLLEAMQSRADNMAPTVVSLTAERNQLAKDKAALIKERDMLKKMLATDKNNMASKMLSMVSVPRTKSAKPEVDESPITMVEENKENTIINDVRTFFLGNNTSIRYCAHEDDEYEAAEIAGHGDSSDNDDPPPPVPSCSPPPSDSDTEVELETTDVQFAHESTPEPTQPTSTAKATPKNSSARRSLLKGLAKSWRKRFTSKDSPSRTKKDAQVPNATTDNPYFGDADVEIQSMASPESHVTYYSAAEEESIMQVAEIMSHKATRGPSREVTSEQLAHEASPEPDYEPEAPEAMSEIEEQQQQQPLWEQQLNTTNTANTPAAPPVPTRAKHDAAVALRIQMKEAEQAVQLTSKALENIRWVNAKAAKISQDGNSQQSGGSGRSANSRTTSSSDNSRTSSGYTRGMRVKKGKVPEWKKKFNQDLQKQRELRRQAAAATQARPRPKRVCIL